MRYIVEHNLKQELHNALMFQLARDLCSAYVKSIDLMVDFSGKENIAMPACTHTNLEESWREISNTACHLIICTFCCAQNGLA